MALQSVRHAAPAAILARASAGRARGTLALPPFRPALGAWLLALPALCLVGLLMLAPTLWLARLSFFESGAVGAGGARFYLPETFTWIHYREVLTDRYFRAVAWSTVRLCAVTSIVSMLLAYPLAAWIDRTRRTAGLLAAWAVALPKLTNALVLLYGVLVLLGNAGLVNRALLALGVVHQPLPMFANLFAVVAGEVLLILPYPTLMLVGVLRATGRELEEAARGLGASPLRAFYETTFRLSLPGAALALLVTLVWAAGAFAAPLVLGNPSLYPVSVEIHTQTFERVDWPVAATLALMHLVAVGALAAGALLLHGITSRRGVRAADLAGGRPLLAAFPPGRGGTGGHTPVHTLARRFRWVPARVLHGRSGFATASGPARVRGRRRRGIRPGSAVLRGRSTSPARFASRAGRLGFSGYAVLVEALLLGPLLFSLLVSLVPGQTIGLPTLATGVSLRWYAALLRDPLWLAGLQNSVLTAGIATALAVPAGAMAAVALDRMPARHERPLTLLLIAPIFTPGVVLGLQALALYHRLGIWGKPYSVGLAHAMWTMPLALLVVRASLSSVDRRLEAAAQGLGASPARAFCLVTLPRLWPSLAAAAFLCAIMSLNELPIALFLATPRSRTLPTLIWPQLRYNLTPAVAAASGVLLVLTLGGVLVAAVLASHRTRLVRLRDLLGTGVVEREPRIAQP